MKYELKDDILVLQFPKDIDKYEVLIFCNWNKIQTISDFLKQGSKIRSEKIFESIIEDFKKNGIKFDDELTEEELNKRNEERKEIEMNRQEIVQRRFERYVSKNIEVLHLSKTVEQKLKQHQITTIFDLITKATYTSLMTEPNLFKQTEIREITSALEELNLSLNLIDPTKEKDKTPEKQEPEKQEETITEKPEKQEEIPEEKPVYAEEHKEEPNPKKVKNREETWKQRLEYLTVFKYYFGHTYIIAKFKDEGMGGWIQRIRMAYNGTTEKKLSQDQISSLEAAGMSWQGVGANKEKRREMLTPLNIKDIELKNGILYTYYLDGSVKSTSDKKFIELLSQYREGKIDLENEEESQMQAPYSEETVKELLETIPEKPEESTENQEESTDMYSLMETRIKEMQAKRMSIIEENQRKQKLIDEYKKLIDDLDTLRLEGMELDDIINSLLGIDHSYTFDEEMVLPQGPLTVDDYEQTREKLAQMIENQQEANERKQAQIEEYRKAEAELQSEQETSRELDSQFETLFKTNDSRQKKIGE